MVHVANTEAEDVRHIRGDVERLRTQLDEDRRTHQAVRDDDRKTHEAQRRDEQDAWRSIVAELSSISGSLKILLDDRNDMKGLVTRVFLRLDTTDARDALVRERLGVIEARISSIDKSANTSGARTWDVVKTVLSVVIGAMITLTIFKK